MILLAQQAGQRTINIEVLVRIYGDENCPNRCLHNNSTKLLQRVRACRNKMDPINLKATTRIGIT